MVVRRCLALICFIFWSHWDDQVGWIHEDFAWRRPKLHTAFARRLHFCYMVACVFIKRGICDKGWETAVPPKSSPGSDNETIEHLKARRQLDPPGRGGEVAGERRAEGIGTLHCEICYKIDRPLERCTMLRIDAPLFFLKGRQLLPIVQGGMGVGVSAHRLAGNVARLGAVGTIASIDLRHHHEDLMERARDVRDHEKLDELNMIALEREVKAALEIAEGNGLVAVNVMKAVSSHAALVKTACNAGAQAIVMGAGLPLDLPDLTVDFPDVALIPILSDVRGIAVVIKKWMRKKRLPDAIVIEHPRYAGGHLGAPKPEEINDPRFDFPVVIEGTLQLFKELGIEPKRVPLIPAGGINTHEKIKELLALGASAVQVGTPFAVTEEGDAHPNFKKVLAEAKPEDIVTFMSVAGLPARAVLTPWLKSYLRLEAKLQECARAGAERCAVGLQCLIKCGLRDGLAKFGQFCIDSQLAAALRGDINKGLFFRGSESLPFGSAIRPVKELLEYLLTGCMPKGAEA